MRQIAFDNDLYLKIQSEKINERIDKFGNKLYLEFGGKLFDDKHAARVLPGFKEDSKLQVLNQLKDKLEVIVVVNSNDINANKIRSDNNITYSGEAERLVEKFQVLGFEVAGIVLSFYQDTAAVNEFEAHMKHKNIQVYKHYKIQGYPQDIKTVVSEEGLGKNEWVKTTRPLVIITAPGSNSGKMATCLSQLYHDNKNGINAVYAKYETFPIWNLPVKDPVNLAYEAATVDIQDINMIDPFHLEAYGQLATNYNRDVETFPLLKAIFEQIYGESFYESPTDMGVNMAGFAIIDHEVAKEAANQEIIRRYYQAKKQFYLGKYKEKSVAKAEILMNQAGVSPADRKCIQACFDKKEKVHKPVLSLELPNGETICGKESDILTAPAACILNALKKMAGIAKKMKLIQPLSMNPIIELKKTILNQPNYKLGIDNIMMILAVQSATNPLSELVLSHTKELIGCQAHSSKLLRNSDLKSLKRLGIDVTEELVSE